VPLLIGRAVAFAHCQEIHFSKKPLFLLAAAGLSLATDAQALPFNSLQRAHSLVEAQAERATHMGTL
jgi:hypothetical protein